MQKSQKHKKTQKIEMGEKGRMVYNRENAIFSDFGQKWAEYGEEGAKLVKKGLGW